MKFILKNILLLFLFAFLNLNSQSKAQDVVDSKNSIKNLELKERTIGLTQEEYIELAKVYNKEFLQHKSLIILNNLIEDSIAKNENETLAVLYNLKAENLVDLKKIEEGVKFCDRIVPEMEKNKSSYFQELCVKCGVLYNKNEDYKKALDTYKNITKDCIKETPEYLNYYGVILVYNKLYDEALIHFKKGVDNSYETNELKFVNINLTNIAKIFIIKKQWKKAKKHLDSAQKALRHSTYVSHRKTLLETYYSFFTFQNRLDEARRVLDHIEIHNNTIYDYEIKQKIKELDAINSRKKSLTKKVTVINNNIKITNDKKLKTYLFLISLITLLTGWTLLKIYNNTQLKYKKVVNEQELLSSQMTPHFIFNSLSILQGMLLNKEKNKAILYIEKFSNILKSTVKEKTQKFTTIRDEIQLLKDYVDIQNLSTSKNISFDVIITENIKEDFLIPSMILQPFIENSIIHGFKTEIENPNIKLNFELTNTKLLCTITDNGIGYSIGDKPRKNQQKTSLATQIVKERLSILSKQMNHNFSLDIKNLNYKDERGTEVVINLPYRNSKLNK